MQVGEQISTAKKLFIKEIPISNTLWKNALAKVVCINKRIEEHTFTNPVNRASYQVSVICIAQHLCIQMGFLRFFCVQPNVEYACFVFIIWIGDLQVFHPLGRDLFGGYFRISRVHFLTVYKDFIQRLTIVVQLALVPH